MSYSRAYNPVLQFIDEAGNPIVSGTLKTFFSGTDTPVATANNPEGSAFNPVQIPLDMMGCTPDVWLDDAISYKFVVCDKDGEQKIVRDNVRSEFSVVGAIDDAITALANSITTKLDKADGVTDVKWDDEHSKIRKTVNGNDSDVVDVQSEVSVGDKRPLNSVAVLAKLAAMKLLSYASQALTDGEKAQARSNINSVGGGDFLPKDSNIFQRVSRILWNGKTGALIVEGHVGAYEGGTLAPLANWDGSDKGKIPFVELSSDSYYNLVYRFILENCATNSDVLQALQRGQIPCFKSLSGTYIPYFVDSNGVMYVYNVFGVSDKNPMTGDALGKSIRRTIYNGNVNLECLWGKPYGLNYIEVAECKCNNNYHLGVGNETIMAWRRIPMDRDMVITAFSLIGKTATVKKAMMVGIFEVDGDSVTNVSASSTWTEDSGYYYNDMENAVRLQDIITSGSGAHPFVTFSLSEPLTLHAGKNYLFPCRFNDDNTYNDPWVYTYKRAIPAMPWEELVRNTTENGDPVMSTALPCCKPSALMLTLSDGTEIWI